MNGRIGALKAVYTGGYLVRNVSQMQDYTDYARGPFAAYYQCNGPQFPAAPARDVLFAELHLAKRREKHAPNP